MPTIKPQPKVNKSAIEEGLKSLIENKGSEIAERIRPILYANLDRGRIQGFTEGKTSRVRIYVRKVAEQYELLSPFIQQLQVERSSEVWAPLFKRMEQWAYNHLLRENYSLATRENASECATDASETILTAFFPYDVDFEPWAHVVVQHACHKFIRRNRKKSVIPEENLLPLDDELETFKDPVSHQDPQKPDLPNELSEAIAQLADLRRQVIELIYLQEYSFEQVARKLDKSIGAVYGLHFHALQDLKKILSQNRDKLNE